DRFLDRTHHVERLLGQRVELTGENSLEAADRVLERHILARRTREYFRHMERLRQEALDLACSTDDQLVLFRQFVHAENRDDVLQFLVTLPHYLHAARSVVMLVAHDQWVKLAAGGIK